MRTRPLPVRKPRGSVILPEAVAHETLRALRSFRGEASRHEGMVFWLGRRLTEDAVVCGAVVPDCEHGPQCVMASAAAIGAVSRRARSLGLGIVAQVHSHPDHDTRHSDGDDLLVLMPFERMFSVVVARYGDGGLTPDAGVGLHQFQGGRWVQIDAQENSVLVIVPTVLHLPE